MHYYEQLNNEKNIKLQKFLKQCDIRIQDGGENQLGLLWKRHKYHWCQDQEI